VTKYHTHHESKYKISHWQKITSLVCVGEKEKMFMRQQIVEENKRAIKFPFQCREFPNQALKDL